MKKLLWITVLGLIAIGGAGLVLGEGADDWGREARHEARLDVAPVTNGVYQNECGSCHMAYPAGLLPARSWRKVIDGLADHFGDNAELDAATASQIRDFLVSNAADTSSYRRSRAIMRSLTPAATPLRISETAYFRHKHDELPARLVTGNPKVKSFANCQACHRSADKGIFNEHDVNVPGAGAWDD